MNTFLAKLLLILPSLTLLISQPARSAHRCGTDTMDAVLFRWCIDSVEGSDNPDVVFYLHGGGGSEQSWRDELDNQLIQSEWLKMGVSAPLVISISFGPTWLLSEIPQNKRPALYPLFVNKLMPFLESKIGGLRGRRMLKGESMGGFNLSQLILKNSHLFDRAVLVCPAIAVVGPYSTQKEINNFMARHEAYLNHDWFGFQKAWAALEFPTKLEWARHSPLIVLENLSAPLPRLHISCGDQDEHGFFEGAQQFAKLAAKKGADVTWQPLKGGHCVADAKAIANFLVN